MLKNLKYSKYVFEKSDLHQNTHSNQLREANSGFFLNSLQKGEIFPCCEILKLIIDDCPKAFDFG